LDIASRTHAGVVDTYTSLRNEAQKVGLVINEQKTKYMKTCSGTVSQQVGDIVNIGGQQFQVVDSFVYLGTLIRADSDTRAEINRRIMSANRCYRGLYRHLTSKLLAKETKCSIYKTLIRPVLLYGCESWPLTKSDEQLLLRFELKVLRTIFGAKFDNGVFRRRYNFELQNDFKEPNIIATVKSNRIRWAGHLARMEDTRAPKILYMNEPEGRRGVGRPKNRWVDGVSADLRTLQIHNWWTIAQDRSRWKSIVEQARSKTWM